MLKAPEVRVHDNTEGWFSPFTVVRNGLATIVAAQ